MRGIRPYENNGNELVLSLVPGGVRRILDAGCGAGDNARLLQGKGLHIEGITLDEREVAIARKHMSTVHLLDLDSAEWAGLKGPFDLVILSHVLEHLRDPIHAVRRLLAYVAESGYVLIAVPNVMEWRTRVELIRGNFRYSDTGIFDRTHLRFFTYETAAEELIHPIKGLTIIRKIGRGAVPLGPFRRHVLPRAVRARLDALGVAAMPNLFAGEIALLAQKQIRSADD